MTNCIALLNSICTLHTSSTTHVLGVHHNHHPQKLHSFFVGASPSTFSPSFPASSAILSSLSMSPDMEVNAGQSVYPLHRCKTIHLVRHTQGFHNVAGEKDHSAFLSEDLFDAELTPLGWQQVDNLRKHVPASGLSKKIELVIVSPLLRTMQMAVGVFGGDVYTNGANLSPLMEENTGVHWCDKRRSINEYKPLFPAIDFSQIENEADILWKLDIRETNEDLTARGMKFLNCFNNCELRSMVIVDRGMIGSDSSTTNYPGKIPSGPDVPRDN